MRRTKCTVLPPAPHAARPRSPAAVWTRPAGSPLPAPLTRRRSLSAPGHVTLPSRPATPGGASRSAAAVPCPPQPATPPPPPPHAAHSLSREQSHLSRERSRGRARAKGTRGVKKKKSSHVLWRAKLRVARHVTQRHPLHWPGGPGPVGALKPKLTYELSADVLRASWCVALETA